MRRLDARALGTDAVIRVLDRAPSAVAPAVAAQVSEIIAAVREKGDAALLDFTERFDRVRLEAAGLAVPPDELATAAQALPTHAREALQYAAARIERFHRARVPESWRMRDEYGSRLGQEVRPLGRVGIYVPGGRAAYPSTVLMTAIPARVAGVREIVLVSPPGRDGRPATPVLAAAHLAGVTEVYRVGGAQAVAALAYGTETIRRVDKVVGPGNIYVTLAKAQVFGAVGIDMLAGPSEILVVADENADPALVAADLLAQAEHDPQARAVLVTPAPALLEAVASEVARQLEDLPRRAIAAEALQEQGALVLTAGLDQALALANALAPEHLELQVADPDAALTRVQNAGAVFLGRATPEVIGDYVAGSSHVLPTGGTARFASGLGLEDFIKRLSVIDYSAEGLAAAWPHVDQLSRLEQLEGHGAAARCRVAPGRHP